MRAAVRRFLTGCAAAAIGVCATSDAHAWYFPEHVVIGRDAVRQLAPEVRAVLRRAVEHARRDGLALCADVDLGLDALPRTRPLQTRMLHAQVAVDCVPYGALAAIGGDHADGARELRTVMTTDKARELTTAAAYEWQRFLDAVERTPAASLERMSFVHELDVDFYFIDPGYELRAQASRAHFVDAGRSLPDVVRNAGTAGAVDNAVGQLLAHHVRSLQLAASGAVTEALLEHGLALHFLEDAFSAGHLVMTERTWANGNTRARRRHDFFDAKGLRVGRATRAETCDALAESFEDGLPPCWTTMGDGHLGATPDSSDRVHVVRAVQKAQLALALALEPASVLAYVDALGERERIAIADLVDPTPWWTLSRVERRRRPATAAHARRLVGAAARAVENLRASPPIRAVDVGRPSTGPLLGADVVATAIDPCRPREAGSPDDAGDEAADAACGGGLRVAHGSVGTSLVRPLLVELPAAPLDVDELTGEARTDHGLALQLFASAGMGAVFSGRAPVDFFAPALGVSMGLSYRLGTYLPGRLNRSAFELNIGIAAALHFDTRGNAGGRPEVTLLEQELRWPILWEMLTSYVLPLDLRQSHRAGRVIVFGGARVREILLDPTPRIWGVEVEAAAFALSSGHGAYPLYAASPELRFHFGVADPSAAQPSFPSTWGPTIGITLTGGYATFL